MTRPRRVAALAAGLATSMVATLLVSAPVHASAAGDREPIARAAVHGPIPGVVPGDPRAERLADTYPFFSTPSNLAAKGYVEEEFYLSGRADGWDTSGNRVATDVPYETRLIVRRPADPRRFSGVALVEWQNVTAGYDLDALWNTESITRSGDAWIGVSAQRVGVDQLRGWSPTRYGRLDVTGGGRYVTDELSYDIFAQAGKAIADPRGVSPLGRLRARTVLAIGASQSAGRMTVYYDRVLPQVQPVFEGYSFVVGSAPTRVGDEPVFQLLSETDVRTPVRPADTDRFRRWEVAGAAHSGYNGQVYRAPMQERDLGAAPVYTCARPPFSRVPMHHVTAAAYAHLVRWVERGTPPPTAPPLVFNPDGTKARDARGLARGGIRLSQVAVPTALNTGDNAGESFCVLFGTYQPFDEATLDDLYPTHAGYVARVVATDVRNIAAGYLQPADAVENLREAVRSGPA
ncbi:alpha/beta hydrolase domain-containing protein [Micromonospora costi]|uniref:alpha/beta hydrolase domain-containing protein n=1 Tax=Micromonospora costi TaxID=1530042 RepID=UPI003408300B